MVARNTREDCKPFADPTIQPLPPLSCQKKKKKRKRGSAHVRVFFFFFTSEPSIRSGSEKVKVCHYRDESYAPGLRPRDDLR